MLLCGRFIETAFAESTNDIPAKFEAKIGGFLGPSYSVILTNGVLVYSSSKEGKVVDSVRIIPTTSQWKEFRDKLDRLNVWQWQDNYYNMNIVDGTQWGLEIKIEHANQYLKTEGSNSFPGINGKTNHDPRTTREFDEYLKAVEKLLGGKTFQ